LQLEGPKLDKIFTAAELHGFLCIYDSGIYSSTSYVHVFSPQKKKNTKKTQKKHKKRERKLEKPPCESQRC
jgi:hypothetical protein